MMSQHWWVLRINPVSFHCQEASWPPHGHRVEPPDERQCDRVPDPVHFQGDQCCFHILSWPIVKRWFIYITGKWLLRHVKLEELHHPRLWKLFYLQLQWKLGWGKIVRLWTFLSYVSSFKDVHKKSSFKVTQVTVTGSGNGLELEMFLDQVNIEKCLNWLLNTGQLHVQQALQESRGKDHHPWPIVSQRIPGFDNPCF